MEISKAQQLRDKQLRQAVSSKITNNLMDFQDMYLADYAAFQTMLLQRAIDKQTFLLNPKALAIHNENGRKDAMHMGRRFYETTMDNVNGRLAMAERQILYPAIRTMRYFNEAKENYDTKINKVIDSVCKHMNDIRFLKIERVSDAGHEFSFLISNNDVEVHARVIYACGEINAPHYRFIVTKRDK